MGLLKRNPHVKVVTHHLPPDTLLAFHQKRGLAYPVRPPHRISGPIISTEVDASEAKLDKML